jgi:L-alanine-DL-glutamate epimerase-like enolase superfamily enzyme
MTAAPARRVGSPVETLDVFACEIPTEQPESDGTFAWDSTTMIVVEVSAGGASGVGYTYGDRAIVTLIRSRLAETVLGQDCFDVPALWSGMGAAIRNAGRPGMGMMALSAVDIALWDLKARLLDVSLTGLLGASHAEVPVYGSGGFTSYSAERLHDQLSGWVNDGITRVKVKVGRSPGDDAARMDVARKAIGDRAELYVDANGAYSSRKQALDWAYRFRQEWDVTWLEEPVSSADFEGLRLLRDRGPAGLDIAAGEYGYVLADFRNLLTAGAVDCLQADVTRCGGITGLLQVAALSAGYGIDVSGHCAPAASLPVLAAIQRLRHLEYFHDHVRLERILFDGIIEPRGGVLHPDRSRPGLGLAVKRADADRYRVE